MKTLRNLNYGIILTIWVYLMSLGLYGIISDSTPGPRHPIATVGVFFLIALPYLILAASVYLIDRWAPVELNKLWPMLVILLGTIIISTSGFYYTYKISGILDAQNGIIFGFIWVLQCVGAVSTLVLSHIIVVINIAIRMQAKL
ncbi:MAG TPA: hypothetical protein PK523_08955 [Elusimicrobiales bacterium]|nr:hypothetical protein [Elusimicrobiales bacterium]